MDSNIYNDPGLYALEHSSGSDDLGFFLRFAQVHRPSRILEIGCGDGRITCPLARAAAAWKGTVAGLDVSASMLEQAAKNPEPVEWIEGDARNFDRPERYDWIFSACASLSHLTTLPDLLAAWRTAARHLAPGGRFLVAELMADLPALADSMVSPPRVPVLFDRESGDGADHLVRFRAVFYRAESQTAHVRFLYDHYADGRSDAERRISEYRAHVFFPHEFRLLFLAAGLEVENVWGGFDESPLGHVSRHLIGCGRKPPEAAS